ncbi:Peptidase M14, carboxypeptidase A [Lysobacter dokdonensis DS-58]|uniref:Peptidase M14, carboxypeptidase A n=1 Tax=Lysobacter dokdonensis DS-58 TaxID=1300345 RepID=A0A0A2WIZ5_9GAMM|nr:M14 family zinc carboxypeptidase [Lysobacter dokdonensis]KGQ19783.1 Peptidase M14, carboxypeptidase A [Lysobacter dokdonensis DS-58]
MPARFPRRHLLAARLAAALALLPAVGLLTAATPVDRFAGDPDRVVLVTVHWANRAQLQQIAGRFEHLRIDEKQRTAVVEANAADLAMLRRMGLRAEIDDAATQKLRKGESQMAKALSGQLTTANAIPGFVCYRTVEETYSTMDQLVARAPSLASVVDIGPTWSWAKTGGAQGYRMRVLRLNNAATDATVPNKPNMVVLAAIHAREYTTAELTTRFAEWLVNGYGTDPEATWMLDNFRFHFLLQANPDGRKKAESGISWRKNTDTDNGACSANAYGVDLNRNFNWQFGNVPNGSSPEPCDATYRGPGAQSENEVQNAVRYIIGTPGAGGTYSGGILPDRRTDTGTAPADYRGMFLDIHSFSQLVLWPWAATNTAAPNMPALRTFGRRLAYFNNYRPVQWTGLYLADGTNTDTVYGVTGAPSYTIELGQEFFEDCSTFESSTYPQNFNALKYAARNLMNPYVSPGGPDAMAMGASAKSIERGESFAVSGWFDDSRYNQNNGAEAVQNIASATAWLDAAPWTSGAVPIAMRASDGAFDTSREQAVVNIDTSALSYGKHVIYVRGTDASGTFGTPSAIYFSVRRRIPDDDYDADRRADLFWHNDSTGQNTIWRAGSNGAQIAVTTTAGGWRLAGQGDFDGDGVSDLFWRNSQTAQNVIWRSGNSAAPIAVGAAGGGWEPTGFGDFNGDGRTDVLWRNSASGAGTIWRSANANTQQAVAPVSNGAWKVVGVGDFDGDAEADILWRNTSTGQNSIWRSGNSATQMVVSSVSNQEWKVVGVGDFDGDGASDILWRNSVGGQNTIWRGASNATQIAMAGAGPAWRAVNVGDYDGDGIADIAWRNPQTGQNLIWKRGSSATQQAVAPVGGAWTIGPYENQVF